MKNYVLPSVACFALLGCSFELDSEDIGTKPTLEICQAYAAAKAGNASKETGQLAAQELAKRPDFTSEEIQLISKGVAAPGMSERAGLCAWGGYWYDVNTTTTAGVVRKQYIFGDGKYSERTYLYTRNGVVTGTQN